MIIGFSINSCAAIKASHQLLSPITMTLKFFPTRQETYYNMRTIFSSSANPHTTLCWTFFGHSLLFLVPLCTSLTKKELVDGHGCCFLGAIQSLNRFSLCESFYICTDYSKLPDKRNGHYEIFCIPSVKGLHTRRQNWYSSFTNCLPLDF